MEEKICQQCKYYKIHYVKTKRGFVKTYCGHCTKKNICHNKDIKNCSNFEIYNKKETQLEQEKHIKNVIKQMQKQLININELLNN